jgi:hypothetical protein
MDRRQHGELRAEFEGAGEDPHALGDRVRIVA